MPITKDNLRFERQNWTLFFIGLGLIVFGLIVMSMDGETYGFGVLGLTVGPMMVLAGFVVEFAAIMYRPKPPTNSTTTAERPLV